MAPPRVRFAPSPTGYLHVGGARTALFNWLFARSQGGTFVLRIEDTDLERSSSDTVDGILEGLRWLGLTWDEGPDIGGPYEPYFQSARIERHRAAARKLFLDGHAYYCYCTPDRLRDAREGAEARGEAWRYDRRCLALSADEVRQLDAAGTPRALRFKVPGGRTAFDDGVHGRIEFEGAHLEDFVVLRADGQPTYHLSVVVDDAEMAITHVIRGDDHISNTPKHVLLFQALGASVPRFAHVPLILGADRKRLSKRHGATSVAEYRQQGYLPDAMVNVLALLGWSPGDDTELMTIDELIARFSLEGVSGSAAVFSPQKLDWMNGQYLARLDVAVLARSVRPLLAAAGLAGRDLVAEETSFHRLLALLRPRATRLTEIVEQARPIVEDEVVYEPEAVEKHLGAPGLAAHLRGLVEALRATAPFDEPHVEAAVRGHAAAASVKAGVLIHALRVAVTGRMASPGLFEVLALLGRERAVARVERLLVFLAART